MNVPLIILKRAKDRYQKALIDESIAQGHYLTGGLQQKQTATFTETPNRSSVALEMPAYGFILSAGVSAKRIPFQEGSGRKTSKYIDGLTAFWMLRGLPEKEAKRAAFATAKKHKREGMPTNASYLFSKNGRRKQFIQTAIQKVRAEVKQQMSIDIKTEFRNLFKQIKRGVI